jgi:hypothetical protein
MPNAARKTPRPNFHNCSVITSQLFLYIIDLQSDEKILSKQQLEMKIWVKNQDETTYYVRHSTILDFIIAHT